MAHKCPKCSYVCRCHGDTEDELQTDDVDDCEHCQWADEEEERPDDPDVDHSLYDAWKD